MRKQNKTKMAGVLICSISGLLCQALHAQSTVESGTSILAPALAPVGGISLNPQEYLTVSWLVTVDAGIYTYNYTVNNPTGDVLENNNGTLTTTSEIVDAFQVAFNATVPGAVVSGPSGGVFQENNGLNGLFWLLSPVAAGTSSPDLSFTSLFGPSLNNANAQDSDPPSPWSSTSPDGQQVPVPAPAPEPSSLALLALAGLLLLPWRLSCRKAVLVG